MAETWRLGYRPSLDGLRGVAVLMVVFAHADTPIIGNAGAVGVSVFFVMSGFLITSLLLEERSERGGVSLRDFYRRRAVRLFPALGAFLAVFAFASVMAGSDPWRDVGLGVSYVSNWWLADGGAMVPAHLWSLAIEEQFYLLWPVVLIVTPRRWLAPLTATAALGSLSLVAAPMSYERWYFGFDTRAFSLLAGCLLAMAMRRGVVPLPSRRAGWLVVGALALSSLDGVSIRWAVVVATVAAVGATVGGLVEVRWLTMPWLLWVGRRSYAIYLWNALAMSDGSPLRMVWWLNVLVYGTATLIAAQVSWRYVEAPFLALRRQRQAATPLPSRTG